MSPPRLAVSERTIVFLIGAIQFINIVDFMIVAPLGPDFARALGIPTAQLGWVTGSYTAAASVAGVAGSFFLDRFDRRPALVVALLGLSLGTLAGAFARDLPTLLAARVVAGAFGGPATSLAMSVIADVIPAERRGKAMGAVMGAFSIASVLGVPAGLILARIGGWRLPFYGVAATALVIAIGAWYLLPSLTIHLRGRAPGHHGPTLGSLLARPTVRMSYLMTAVTMMAGFMVIPNLSAFVQNNLGYPRERLELLYAVGGAVSFVTLRLAGRGVDRFGSTRVGTFGSVALMIVLVTSFVLEPPLLPPLGLFVGFMLAMGLRNVAYNTLTSKVPEPHERARFVSFQSAVQHAASAAGAFLAAQLLATRADGSLVGLPGVTLVSIGLTALLPFLLASVEARVRAAGPS